MAEFEIYEDQNNPGEFRWRLRANNNEIMPTLVRATVTRTTANTA